MKKSTLMLFVMCLLSPLTYAGTTYSGKEMKQVAAPPPPCPWYADNEFNVSLWGTYISPGTIGRKSAPPYRNMAGAVVSMLNTFSIVISVLASKAGWLIRDRRAK